MSSSADRVVTIAVVAGSAVSFNSSLDENCVNQSIEWMHYSGLDTRQTPVKEDLARGWSVLNIPSASFTRDHGRFLCVVPRLRRRCQMNFQLTVTGKFSKI